MEKTTWYDKHGLPNPDRPDQIVAHRERKESERQIKKEEDFWAELGTRLKFRSEVTELKSGDAFFNAMPAGHSHCVSSEADIKLTFQKDDGE